jgi:hypothetical protein
MFTRKSLVVAALTLTLGGLGAGSASIHASSNADHLTFLTFSGPVALPGVTLGAGTYVFDLVSPGTNADVVRVRNKARTQTYFLGITKRTSKPASMPTDRHIVFGEASKDMATPIAVWYPTDGSYGHQFLYRR